MTYTIAGWSFQRSPAGKRSPNSAAAAVGFEVSGISGAFVSGMITRWSQMSLIIAVVTGPELPVSFPLELPCTGLRI